MDETQGKKDHTERNEYRIYHLLLKSWSNFQLSIVNTYSHYVFRIKANTYEDLCAAITF